MRLKRPWHARLLVGNISWIPHKSPVRQALLLPSLQVRKLRLRDAQGFRLHSQCLTGQTPGPALFNSVGTAPWPSAPWKPGSL